MKNWFFVICMSLLTANALAGQEISGVWVSGPDDPDHPDVIQFSLVGGIWSGELCEAEFAAIRNTPDRKHLISFFYSAYFNKEPINVVLNTSDRYYGNRCTVSRIFKNP